MGVHFVTAVLIYVLFNTLTFSAILGDDERQLRMISKAIEQNEETQRILGNIDKSELVVLAPFIREGVHEGSALFVPQSEGTNVAYDFAHCRNYYNSHADTLGMLPGNDKLACYRAFRLTNSEDRTGTIATKDPEKWQAFLQAFKKRKSAELEQEALNFVNEKSAYCKISKSS